MSGWQIRKVPGRPDRKRAFIWEVTCPYPTEEPSWDNDFGRGVCCGCRRFPTEGKATRYVERMTRVQEVAVDVLPEGIIVTPSGKLVVEW